MKIIDIVKSFFNRFFNKNVEAEEAVKNEDIKEQEEVQGDIKSGSIIMAVRENSEHIQSGHKIGPFLVYKNDNNILAFYGTGTVPSKSTWNNKTLKLTPLHYQLTKDTYFDLGRLTLIPYENCIRKIDMLGGEELKEYHKKLEILSGRNMIQVDTIINEPISTGDIINYNGEHYLVISEDDLEYQALKVTRRELHKYNYHYNNVSSIPKLESLKRFDYLDRDETLKVLKRFQSHILDREKIGRGSIITFENNNYYIYGEEGEYYLTCLLGKEMQENVIEINGEKYNLKSERKIHRQDPMKFIIKATEDEMDNIKKVRKNMKKVSREEMEKNKKAKAEIKKRKKYPEIGDIIIDHTLAHSKYIVYDFDGNYFYCYYLDDLARGKKISYCFSLKEISILHHYDDDTLVLLEEIKKIPLEEAQYVLTKNLIKRGKYENNCG